MMNKPDNDSDSEYSEDSSQETSSSESSSFDQKPGQSNVPQQSLMELAKIGPQILQLPKDLCEKPDIFYEFFSMETWQEIPPNLKAFLKNKLPHFPTNCNADFEQEKTLKMLFNNEIKIFDKSPLEIVQKNLEDGNYRPELIKLQDKINNSRRSEQQFHEWENVSNLAKSLLISREKLLRKAYNSGPDSINNIEKIINNVPKLDNSVAALKAKKRYFNEIQKIANELDIKDLSDKEDEEIEELKFIKDDKVPQNNNEIRIIGTMVNRSNILHGTAVTSNPAAILNDKHFSQILKHHKKRRIEGFDRPEFETNDIRITDVLNRVEIAGGNNFRTILLAPPKPRKLPAVAVIKPYKYLKMEHKQQSLLRNDVRLSKHHNSMLSHSTKHVKSLSIPQDLQLSSSSDEEINIETLKTNSPSSKSQLTLNFQNISQIEHSEPNNLQKISRSILPATPVSSQIPSTKKRTQNLITNFSVKKQNLNGKESSLHSHTIPELENLDILQLPVELEESINILNPETVLQKIAPPTVELMQETHACFLSLIRDIFCSTPNHRMKIEELNGKIYHWLLNPITALNDWYPEAENWLILIPSAIYFLSGDFLNQPEEFVPYIEFKAKENIYQWIGAGRDSDNRLLQLCQYWLNRRNDMGMKPNQVKNESCDIIIKKSTENDNSYVEVPNSPPPPRVTTTWQVKPAKPEEIEEFRIQERKRFENPHKAFTYLMNGYESVVGPVKGIYTQTLQLTKARGHNTLLADRPNFVTILTLVRDATARLPNGEGTRAEICELLKSSQYISPDAPDNVIHTIVSGALDRMHIEHDPCVRYDPKRKIWIYLHRNRTEEEFERLHQQTQGISKLPKKSLNRKMKQKAKKSADNVILARNNLSATIQQSLSHSPAIAIQTSMLNQTVISKAVPIQQQPQPVISNLTPIQSSLTSNHAISPKLQQKQIIIKPELVNHINSPVILEKENDLLDLNEPLPFILQKPLNFQQKLQTTTKKLEIKTPLPSPVKTSLTPTTELNLQTSLPSQLQTVNLVTTIPENILPQQILASPTISTKLSPINKIAQCQQSQIITQARIPCTSSANAQQQSYVIPLSSEQLQVISSIPGTLQSTMSSTSPKSIKIQNQPIMSVPSLTSTIGARPILVQQGKNIIRVTQTSNKIQQQPKINIQQNSPTGTTIIRPQLNQTKQTVSIIGNATLRGTNAQAQQLTSAQQKQLIQSIVQQQKIQQRLITSNTSNTLIIGNSTGQQTKVVETSLQNQPQQFPKIINVSGQNIITTPVTTTANTNLMNPQIIQIHQPSGTKIQTINANMLQNIKQQTVRLPNAQQSLIIKPQSTKVSNIITNSTTSTKTVIGTNIITTNSTIPKAVIQTQGIKTQKQQQFTIVQTSQPQQLQQAQQQPQMVTRIIKSGTGPNTPASIIQPIQRTQSTSTPVKVLTNTSGQIISLESLLQKQGITQGTTLRVSGNNTTLKNQGNLIQLSNSSQLSQFTMVPQNRIISVSGQQSQQTTRLITSQAVSKGGITATTNISNMTTTPLNIQNPGGNAIGTTVQLQAAPRIIPANQLTPQLVNAKVLTKSPNIRMVNASNINLANLRTTVGGKQVLISANKTQGNIIVSAGNTNIQNTNTQSSNQNVHFLQTNASGNIVIGGQTLKMQGNVLQQGNIQVFNQSSQSQGVMLGNQIIKVAPSHTQTIRQPQTVSANNSTISNPLTTIASSMNSNTVMVNSNPNQQQPHHRTILLNAATGQTIRLQSPNHVQQNLSSSTPNQQIIVGTPVKANQLKSTSNVTVSPNQQQRIVLVQGGSQILLPPGFQGGSINLKNLKVVSRAPPQQQQLQNQINKNKTT